MGGKCVVLEAVLNTGEGADGVSEGREASTPADCTTGWWQGWVCRGQSDPKAWWEQGCVVLGDQQTSLTHLLPAAGSPQGQAAFSLSVSVPQMQNEDKNTSSLLPAQVVQL